MTCRAYHKTIFTKMLLMHQSFVFPVLRGFKLFHFQSPAKSPVVRVKFAVKSLLKAQADNNVEQQLVVVLKKLEYERGT